MRRAAYIVLALAVTGAVRAADQPPRMTDHQRIEALERRVQQLELARDMQKLLDMPHQADVPPASDRITVGLPPIRECATTTEGNTVTTKCK